jgi:hypothetical protein
MKKLSFLFLLCLLAFASKAQTTDLSGKWSLNAEKSKLNADFSMAPAEMIITQNGNDLNIEKHMNFQGQTMTTTDKLTLDGKECSNTGFMDSPKKSTASWSEDKSLKVLSKMSMQDNEIATTEIYKKDGNNLVLDSSNKSSFGDMTEVMVFDKK